MFEIAEKINELVSSIAACDRDGCRCWEAVNTLHKIAEIAREEVELHGPAVGFDKKGGTES